MNYSHFNDKHQAKFRNSVQHFCHNAQKTIKNDITLHLMTLDCNIKIDPHK